MIEESRIFKDQVYGQFARVGKALASARRLELLDLLSQGPKSVEGLAREMQASVANVSQHLQTLAQARLVTAHKQGTFVIYRLANSRVTDLLRGIQGLSEEVLAEVRELRQMFLTQRDVLDPVGREELVQMMENPSGVYLIDVRSGQEYEAGHLRGAVSVPLPEVADHFRDWSGPQQIVAYCRGAYCLYARDAVAVLGSMKITARRTEVSVHDWH